MGIKQFIINKAKKTADKIATLSSLSPKQIEDLEKQRVAYLEEKPSPTDENSVELTNRLIGAVSTEVFNAYLPQIKELYVPVESNAEFEGNDFNSDYNICYVKITRLLHFFGGIKQQPYT